MRLLELHLAAFGPFTGVKLDLDAGGPALHVIHGRNEAGKSTALRALDGLFYGIPRNTTDAHVHPMNKLRVGGRIVAADGRELAFVRRKRDKATLTTWGDEPIDDAVLEAMLGGVPREQFLSMFGLDHETLRRGAENLLAARGDVGESLFDAGTGGRGIHAVLAELEAQSDDIFRPRGTKQTLNAAMRDLKEAQRRLREANVSPDAYAEQIASLDEAKRRHAELQEQRRARKRDEVRLARDLKVIPLLAKRRTLLAAPRDGDQPTSKLAALPADAMEELHNRIGGYRNDQRDLPKRRAEHRQIEAEAEARLARLGSGARLADVESLRVPAATRATVHDLAQQAGSLEASVAHAREALEAGRAAHARARERSSGLAALRDVGLLEAGIDDALASKNADRELAASRRAHDALAGELARAVDALGLGAEKRVALSALPVPSRETVEREAARWDATTRKRDEAIDRERAAGERLRRAEQERATLAVEGHLPTEAGLDEERRRRDAIWKALRRRMEGRPAKAEKPSKQARLALDDATPDAYEDAVAGADRTSDRLRREAERVARNGQLLADAERARADAEAAQRDAARFETELRAAADEWAALWASVGIVPHAPPAMRDFVERHARAVALEKKLGEAAAMGDELEAHRDRVHQALADALRAADEAGAIDGADLDALVRVARAVVKRERGREAEAREARETEGRAAEDVARLERAEDRHVEAYSAWKARWAEQMRALGLPPDASPSAARAVLDLVDDILAKVDAAAGVLHRIRAMEENARAFESDLDRLVAEHAPELAGAEPFERASRLYGMWQDAVRAAEKRSEDEAEIREIEHELERIGDGVPILELERALEGRERGHVAAELDEVERERAQLDEEIEEARAEIERKKAGIEPLGQRTTALEAADDVAAYLARVRTEAQRYVRIKLAASILRTEVERYRDENQGPVLKRTSELFPRLTLGRYVGVRTDVGADDEPVLACVRSSGEQVGVEALSDGTRDPLYLALRLASLERHVERDEPLPLVLDDCLVHFDDERARAALEVLGEVARRFQVLFFTHHGRLVELAREAVPEARLSVIDLDQARTDATALTL